MAALTGATLLPACATSRQTAKSSPVSLPGLQLYMLGAEVEKDFSGTLQQVAAIGYREVELPSFYNRKGVELRAALDANGLSCPGVHIAGQPFAPSALSLAADPAQLSQEVAALGAHYVVMPLFLIPERLLRAPRAGESMLDLLTAIAANLVADDWKRTADFLNEKGAILARSGLRLAYHTHNPEFAPLAEGGNGLELLMKHTDPKLVGFELDIGWVAAAGHDPVEVLARYPGRFPLMHLKDLEQTPANTSFRINSVDVGTGVIAWDKLLPAARKAGIVHYFIEQEPPFKRPPIDSARTGFEFLQKAFRTMS
jgi:sugar phosphate isomerase/epimerase